MKKYLFLFCLIMYFGNYAQELGGYKELYIRTEGISSSDTIYFRLRAVDKVWDEDFEIDTKFYYSGKYYTLVDTTIKIIDNYILWRKGWDQIRGLTGLIEPPFMGYSLYELLIKKGFDGEEVNFYTDFRDSDWPDSYPCGNDIYVYYSGIIDGVWVQWGESSCTVTYPDNNSFYQHWSQKGKSLPNTDSFENFWQNCLVLIPTIDNHPRLVWGLFPESVDIAGYNIYRKVASGSYSLIRTNSDTEFDYVDTEYYILRQGYVALSYYVKALYTTDQFLRLIPYGL